MRKVTAAGWLLRGSLLSLLNDRTYSELKSIIFDVFESKIQCCY